MLVYLRLMTFIECKMNDHYMCRGVTLSVDESGSKHVGICECKCHETEPVPVRTGVEVTK